MPSVWFDCAAVFGREMVIVPLAPLSDWLRVMLLPPANRNRTCAPEAMPVVPLVFPRFDIPIDCDSADWDAALIVMVPEAPLSDWERVTLFPPARRNRTCAPDAIPVVPEVLPMLLMPMIWVSAVCAATLIVIV